MFVDYSTASDNHISSVIREKYSLFFRFIDERGLRIIDDRGLRFIDERGLRFIDEKGFRFIDERGLLTK